MVTQHRLVDRIEQRFGLGSPREPLPPGDRAREGARRESHYPVMKDTQDSGHVTWRRQIHTLWGER